VATPHVLRDAWLNEDVGARNALLRELNRRVGGIPRIEAGCEYYFSSDALELCEPGGPITMLANTSYLLVEFPPTRVPDAAEAVFHELSIRGITPVIAHPERNLALATSPDKLARLVELGAVTQITAGSVTGEFGKAATKAVEAFFARGLVHVIASDAHSVTRRPPVMSAARERIRSRFSSEIEIALFEANPAAILNGIPLPFDGK
jgi:protein-tyrosine phosphatase